MLVLSSISWRVSGHQQLEGIFGYLGKHGQHVGSINLRRPDYRTKADLPSLPHNLTQLTSLALAKLAPGGGHQGVLGPAGAPSLKQLRLHSCKLLDWEQGLEAALAQLSGLQHLSIRDISRSNLRHLQPIYLGFTWSGALQGLQQLTHLELLNCLFGSNDLRHLQGLTLLQVLRMVPSGRCSMTIQASTLAGLQLLTRLELGGAAICCTTDEAELY